MATLANTLIMVRSVKLCHFTNQNEDLPELTLFAFIQQCPLLETLEMTGSAKIVGEEASAPLGIGNAEMRTLDLSYNDGLSDGCLEKIVLACPNLERLQLRGCSGISSKCAGEILRNCHSLKQLKMDECSGVRGLGLDTDHKQQLKLEFLGASSSGLSDKALIDIAERCPHLMFLNVRDCKGLTSVGVKRVVDKCTKLKDINLSHCENVSGSIMPWMVFCNLSLRIILPPQPLGYKDANLYIRRGCCVGAGYGRPPIGM